MTNKLAPLTTQYTWVTLSMFFLLFAVTAMIHRVATPLSLKTHNMTELRHYIHCTSIADSSLTVCEGSPICRCLRSGIRPSLRGRLPQLGRGCEGEESRASVNAPQRFASRGQETRGRHLPPVFVQDWFGLLVVYLMEERCEDPPRFP